MSENPWDMIVSMVPASCPRWGRGWCAAAAGILEAWAPKPGNVHPDAAFADLDFADLTAAACAIAPACDAAPSTPLGRTILAAVTASRAVTRSNANLGIVLAIAPLAAVRDAECATPSGLAPRPVDVARVLAALTPEDAADVWRAIGTARPGGMGTSPHHDLTAPAPPDLMEAMRIAAPRDAIARLWAEGYDSLYAGPVADLSAGIAADQALDELLVNVYLRQLARQPDSLIARKRGTQAAADVSRRAAAAIKDRGLRAAFDHHLRTGDLNPGTTADLVAAALYILLVNGQLRPPPARDDLPQSLPASPPSSGQTTRQDAS